MWDRRELKARAKEAFKANYWRCVLVAFLVFALVGGGAASSGRNAKDNYEDLQEALYGNHGASYGVAPVRLDAPDDPDIDGLTPARVRELLGGVSAAAGDGGAAMGPIFAIIGGVLALVVLAASAVDILVFNPITVSAAHFFTKNTREPATLDTLKRGFTPHWINNVVTLFLRDLFLWLWALLLVVPAIVKAYAYRMVPYIMAEHPDMKGAEAITLSRRMMKGSKWNAFVFDLSFLGWELLSAVTAGIAGVFWVRPYKAAANAELYRAVSAGFFDGEAEYVDAEIVYEPELPEIE